MGNFGIEQKRVLILDDNKLNVELLEETLKPLKLSLYSFYNPQAAINSLIHTKYDLFLLDIMIPEISGFDVAKVIRNSEINKNAPIIFISALSDEKTKIESYNLGSVAYIEKPFNINILQSQILNLLKLKDLQEAVLASKDKFFAMATHDLKTPIYAEIRALEILLKNNENATEHDLINEILNSSKYMKNLVENILIKYKSENNKINLQISSYSLEDIIQASIDEVQYLLKDKKQKIRFKNSTKNSICSVDFVEIKRTINNLLSNAHQYAPANSVISIELSDLHDFFHIKITNKTICKFEIPETSKSANAGLGLYICKKIIELHNGKFQLETPKKDKMQICISLPKYQALPR